MATPGLHESAPAQQVRTRRVHYISGFDPRGARYYHHLYAEEAPKQSLLNGSILTVGKRRKINPHVTAWSVEGEWKEGVSVTTEYEFMSWDDIVRKHWDASFRNLFQHGIPIYIKCILGGGFNRIWRISKGAFYTSMFPFFYLALLAALLVVVVLAGMFFGKTMVAIGMAVGLAFGLGWAGLRLAEQFHVFWVLRTCVFIVVWGTHPPPELEERIAEMADRILQQQQEQPVDEVLIIGHSVGSMVAVAVTAHILEKAGQRNIPPSLNLLTLGQCIPYLTFIPTAGPFRRDLQILGNDDRIPWTDATSPPDPLCFFQVDPIRVSGLVSRFEEQPKRVAVRIFKMFSSKTYALMRRNKLRLHFQYLMASELPSDYDYFLITAGPGKLRAQSGGAKRPA